MTKPQTLPVIFRADIAHGETWITAVFPTLTEGPGKFTVYQHIGQHGTGSLAWHRATRPATPEEYAPLLKELQEIYAPEYTLVVRKRR